MQILLPLSTHPTADPESWATVLRHGDAASVLLDIGDGPGSGRDPGWTVAIARLASAGITALGYVDLALGTRPMHEVRADVRRWAGYPVAGVLLDQAPTSPYLVGPVATAISAAHRAGLDQVVLNHGQWPDPVYRALDARLCVFDGSWTDLQANPVTHRTGPLAGPVAPGDAYLVHSVPAAERERAYQRLADRQAGLALITDRVPPAAYRRLPSWLSPAVPDQRPIRPGDAAVVGSAGRRTTTGS